MTGHVLRRGISVENERLLLQAAAGEGGDGPAGVVIVSRYDETVVPILEDPSTHALLQDGEVDDAADRVKVARGVDEDQVVVAVEVGASALVTNEAVPGAEMDSSNNLEAQWTGILMGTSATRLLRFRLR